MICQSLRWTKPKRVNATADSLDPHSIEGIVYDFYHVLILLNWIYMTVESEEYDRA